MKYLPFTICDMEGRSVPKPEDGSYSDEEERRAQEDSGPPNRHLIQSVIANLRKEFASALSSLSAEVRNYMEESARVQTEMLNRIKELKAEVAQVRKESSKDRRAVRSSLYSAGARHPRKLCRNEV
jgi:Mg2+ and Co2+ transporter CorA